MAIIQKRAPPAAGENIIGRALQDLWGRPDPRDLMGGATINLSKPLPVYRLQLEDIGKPDTIGMAKPVAWRYLLEKAGGVAYADLVEAQGGAQTFASLSRNPNAYRLSQAAHVAEKVAKDLPDCEARILDVPALHLSAVWLSGPDSKFIPYIDQEKLPKPDSQVKVDPDFMDRVTRRAEELKRHNLPNSQQAG
jgi:hypothetical protein